MRILNICSFFLQPSFGYIITSPEKREPFALIHPSEISARDNTPLSDTIELSEADKTLGPGVFTVLLWRKYLIISKFCLFYKYLHCAFVADTHDLIFAEDLDKTLEAPGERMSPKGDTNPEPCERKVVFFLVFFLTCYLNISI